MKWDRVILLGEDRAHLDFLRELSTRQGWQVLFEHIAPKGRGAASGWVVGQFPDRLQEIAGGRYKGLGLLVAIDGDNVGRVGRLQMLALASVARNIPQQSPEDPVALLVPTWSIDTWLVFFHKHAVIPETTPSKNRAKGFYGDPHTGFLAPGAAADEAPRPLKKAPLRSLLDGFLSDKRDDQLPSLDESRADFRRWTS